MADKRIKDLTNLVPVGTEYLPFDSAGAGTGNNTITFVVDVGNQTISNPIIGVNDVAKATTVRTQLLVSGTSTYADTIQLLTGSDNSGNPFAAIIGKTIQNGSFLIDSEHTLTISASSCVVSGWGGRLNLQGGHGGINHDGSGFGGSVQILGGNAGTFFSGSGNTGSAGGDLSFSGGAGNTIAVANVNGGTGGNVQMFGGSAGALTALTGNGNGGDGGSVFIGGGNAAGNQATGSGGNGGSVSLNGGDGGQSFAGRAGGGGSVSITAGRAGVGSAAKPFHSGTTIADGGFLQLQAGSPSAGFTNYTSGAAGNLFLYGGRIFALNKFVSGTRVQIGASGSDGSGDGNTTYAISRIFINAPVVTGSGFPGTDIFLFVSGTTGGKGVMSGTVAAFGGDMHISGNLTIDGTNNPLCKVVSSSTYIVSASDFSNAVAMTQSGSITASFTSNLTASFPTGRLAIVVLQVEHTGAFTCISMSGGTTLNGLTSNYNVPTTGSLVISFTSRNGLNWFR